MEISARRELLDLRAMPTKHVVVPAKSSGGEREARANYPSRAESRSPTS
jgi:hypothetical protein